MRIWGNWQTRLFQKQLPKGVRVQVSLSAPLAVKGDLMDRKDYQSDHDYHDAITAKINGTLRKMGIPPHTEGAKLTITLIEPLYKTVLFDIVFSKIEDARDYASKILGHPYGSREEIKGISVRLAVEVKYVPVYYLEEGDSNGDK
jgi:hypothetical protein